MYLPAVIDEESLEPPSGEARTDHLINFLPNDGLVDVATYLLSGNEERRFKGYPVVEGSCYRYDRRED